MSALPPSDPSIADFAYHSSDEILAHSRFPAARAASSMRSSVCTRAMPS